MGFVFLDVRRWVLVQFLRENLAKLGCVEPVGAQIDTIKSEYDWEDKFLAKNLSSESYSLEMSLSCERISRKALRCGSRDNLEIFSETRNPRAGI